MSDKAITVIGTNVVIDCGTVEEALAYERELWVNQPASALTVAPEHRERMQRFETGRNDETDTYHVAATDRTVLINQIDELAHLVRGLRAALGSER